MEIQGDSGRFREIQGYSGGFMEIQGDSGGFREIQGDSGKQEDSLEFHPGDSRIVRGIPGYLSRFVELKEILRDAKRFLWNSRESTGLTWVLWRLGISGDLQD